jgi:hypothetical protein
MVLEGNIDDVVIQLDEDTVIIHALEEVTISLMSEEFPSGTLRFKKNQVIMLPVLEEEL